MLILEHCGYEIIAVTRATQTTESETDEFISTTQWHKQIYVREKYGRLN